MTCHAPVTGTAQGIPVCTTNDPPYGPVVEVPVGAE